VIAGNRQLIALAHKKGIRAIGTTIPPYEHAIFRNPFFDRFYSPEKEKIRQEVNAWIRSSGKFDGVIDFDEAVHDPSHPTQLCPLTTAGIICMSMTQETSPRRMRFLLRCFTYVKTDSMRPSGLRFDDRCFDFHTGVLEEGVSE
jgi:hypothetical protein